jgi:hypothetical protein
MAGTTLTDGDRTLGMALTKALRPGLVSEEASASIAARASDASIRDALTRIRRTLAVQPSRVAAQAEGILTGALERHQRAA